MPLTDSGLEQLASAKLLLSNTQGFMYLPVLVPHELAAEAVLSELQAANEAGGYAWLALDWPTLSSGFDQPPSRAEITEARQLLLSRIDAIIDADTSAPRAVVLDASPSTRHLLAQDVIVYVNQRRQLLRERALRLIVAWPLALRDDLIGGAPDLWSVRTIAPSLSMTDSFLPESETSAVPVQSLVNEPQNIIFDTAAQEHKYALWKATGNLEAADLSGNEINALLNVLSRHHRGQEMLELSNAARAQSTSESTVADLTEFSAVAFAELGEFNAAVQSGQDALAIYRRLAQANPAAYEPDLAGAVNNLAVHLSEVGDRAGALDAAREAAMIYRRLAKDNAAAYETDLAMSINNLASFLSETTDRAGSLDTAREAVSIYRRLTRANPATYEPNLAVSISNLATCLSQSGDRAEALNAAREAVAIHSRLARANPVAYEPNLALSISNLAGFLSDAGDRAGALDAAREAAWIRRRLARPDAAGYEPDLARSLVSLAQALSADDKKTLARETAAEAVTLLRPWAKKFPEAYGGLLGTAEALVAKLDAP